MNKSMIKEVYYGNHGGCEYLKPTKDYKKILNDAIELENKIKCFLNEEERKTFEDFCNAQGLITAEVCSQHYIEGFKIGLCIGVECYNDKEDEPNDTV